MNIFLKHNKGFHWQTGKNIYFKGYFYVDDLFYEKENALNYLNKINGTEEFKKLIKSINGVFTILKKEENTVLIITDVTRSFPVFFAYYEENWLFSDDIHLIKEKLDLSNFNTLAETEFIASNHVHGSKTLLENVYQTQSSEYIFFKEDEIIDRNFYFSYSCNPENFYNKAILQNKAITTFENSFQRLINSLQSKTVVIPLSSGFDSRLIAVMLKKNNYKKVVCYTYGRKDSFEIENSKKTAKALHFEWHFIEYNNALIDNFLSSDEFKNYAHFAGKLSSMPNLQEYFAVKYLKENHLIPNDSIFIPGYAGDILGGSEFINTIPKKLKIDALPKALLENKIKNYHLNKDDKQQIAAEIKKNLFLFDNNYQDKNSKTVFDDYNLKERIAKYIFNSANFYSFFGYEFRFPFWDRHLLDFFKHLPIQLKEDKVFFDTILINNYFKPFNVYFENENQPKHKSRELQKLKNLIKPFLPIFIKHKILQKNDWNNYDPITTQMLLEMKKNGFDVKITGKDYNEIITQWYLYFSKKMIK